MQPSTSNMAIAVRDFPIICHLDIDILPFHDKLICQPFSHHATISIFIISADSCRDWLIALSWVIYSSF